MPTPEEEALEAAAWQAFVKRLANHLSGVWPAMPERLGERYDAFVDAAVQQAGERGFEIAAGVARYANLWFVWGPAFHDRPGFEWAQGILAAPREREWVKVHQLVQRSLAELARLPGTRIEPQTLKAVDERLIDLFCNLGRRGRLRAAEPPALPRAACDIEAAELRLLDEGGLQRYVLDGDEWQRQPVALPASVRVDAARPMPERVWLLSPQAGRGAPTRVQLRSRSHQVCDGDRHPALGFLGPRGKWSWVGHETRAVSWPVATREQPLPAPGVGAVVAEETSPEFYRIELVTCGLRDEGDPIGPLVATASVLPAEQWWVELQRAQPNPQVILPGPRSWTRAATRCRVECEGRADDGAALKRQFEDGLDAEVAVGVQKLAAAWEQVPGLGQPGLEATLGLLVGRASMTWGWQYAPGGLDAAALMRVVARFEMRACEVDLQLSGELALAGTRSRLALRAAGQVPLKLELRREAPEPGLAEVLTGAVASWRLPFTLALDPIAGDTASLLQPAAAPTGAFVGEAGLRPRLSGGSGFEWFARLRVEPVALPVVASDPLLGLHRQTLALLPALSLLDWSAR